MTAPTTTPAAEQYLAEVERELGDLPADERAELLEDLAMHLTALQEEPDERPLTERLGSSTSYAAELRSAAGLPPRTALASDDAPSWFRTAAGAVAGSSAFTEIRAFLPQLRPAWWVLRGYLVVAVPSLRDVDGSKDFPVPAVMGNHALGLLLVGAAVVASVAIGRRQLPRLASVGVIALNVVLILAALDLLASAQGRLTRAVLIDASASPVYGPLVTPHGLVTNVFPYAADGSPLEGVLLYDQDGRPLTTGLQEWWADDCRRVLAQPRAADGVPVPFSFPQQYVLDPLGQATVGVPVAPGQCRAMTRPAVPLPVFPKTVTASPKAAAPSSKAAVPSAPPARR